ncbi:MAG: metal ABC transporter permease [Helicobacteraceae bacterium]|jgi:zinc/manganese transport system permease protein|nr:metal ABC transporter permease [Helicobacteraceae bacterium]
MIEILGPVGFLVVVLVAIHSWFGLRIIKRGIIFTDLAIGQIAALGSAISVGLFHAEYLYLWTLGFALIAAALIAFSVQRLRYIEAFIGLVYVLGASGVMIVLSQSPEGMEHFRELLAADILFTSTQSILESTLIYALIGLLLIFVLPRTKGVIYEMLFFTLLAVTVTSSVQLAGVLVVFVLLIAPALIALVQNRFQPYIIALVSGSTFGIAAVTASFYLDLPTGYAIVFFGAFSALTAVLVFDRKKRAD